MSEPVPDEPDTSRAADPDATLRSALEGIAADPARRVFAAMDGTLLDPLPRRLAHAGLWARPLVAETASRDQVRLGPWLVDPGRAPVAPAAADDGSVEPELTDEALAARADAMAQEAARAMEAGDEAAFGAAERSRWTSVDPVPQLAPILELAGEVPGLVFWIGDASLTAERLHAHLRGLGQVRVPSERRAPDGETHETVIFRHADANVLAQVLPVLDAPRQARLLGPADAVIFLPAPAWRDPEARSAIRILRRQADAPAPAAGMLVIDGAAVEAMGTQRAAAARARRIAILQESSPTLFTGMNEREIARWAEAQEQSGRAIGIRTERGLLQWAYLAGGSNGGFAHDPAVRAHLATGQGTPDRKLDAMMSLMVRASRESAR